MSFFSVKIKPTEATDFTDVTKDVLSLGSLREFNDESKFFSGVFRRGSLEITLDNNNNLYTTGHASSIFSGQRENSAVEIFYNPNDKNITSPILIFRGLITEGSTENDITSRNLNITCVDGLKLIRDLSLSGSDLKAIDSIYKAIRGSQNIRVNKHYLAAFLYYCFNTLGDNLNDVFNVFTNNDRTLYPNINASIEGLFSGDNSFYSATNTDGITLLNELLRTLNCYSSLEYFEDKTELHIKARPTSSLNPAKTTSFTNQDILRVTRYLDGFNRVYNSISINNSEPYVRQSSINRYGARSLNINTIMPASSFIASTYLDYYSEPKKELDLILRVKPETLSLRIGDVISLNVEGRSDLAIQGVSETMYIINRALDFNTEVITFRLRQL